MKVLENMVCFFLDIRLWTGRKKLRPEDIKARAGAIPPEKLASLGSKRICDPKELAPFSALKKRAERACEARGIKFLGGYAVPEARAEELLLELESIEDEFQREKEAFLARYDQALEAWIAENSEWAGIIRAATEPVKTVARQLQCGHQCFKIGTVSPDAGDAINAGLSRKVGAMGDRLVFEVSRDAEKIWEGSLRGKERVTQKALRPIKTLLDKVKGLAFLDGRAALLADKLEAGLEALPKHGPIEGQDLNALCGLVLQIADPEGVKAIQVQSWETSSQKEEPDEPEGVSEEAPEEIADDDCSEPPSAPVVSGWF